MGNQVNSFALGGTIVEQLNVTNEFDDWATSLCVLQAFLREVENQTLVEPTVTSGPWVAIGCTTLDNDVVLLESQIRSVVFNENNFFTNTFNDVDATNEALLFIVLDDDTQVSFKLNVVLECECGLALDFLCRGNRRENLNDCVLGRWWGQCDLLCSGIVGERNINTINSYGDLSRQYWSRIVWCKIKHTSGTITHILGCVTTNLNRGWALRDPIVFTEVQELIEVNTWAPAEVILREQAVMVVDEATLETNVVDEIFVEQECLVVAVLID
ncbi:hypothetical protein D3C71_826480 [compost metagenome]